MATPTLKDGSIEIKDAQKTTTMSPVPPSLLKGCHATSDSLLMSSPGVCPACHLHRQQHPKNERAYERAVTTFLFCPLPVLLHRCFKEVDDINGMFDL